MDKRIIVNGVFSVGAIDWDRRYFDEIIFLPEGTSYNSYLIFGSEKTALIDTVDPTKSQVLMDNLSDVKRIDYLISNHAEQDHSGTIPLVLAKYPECKLVCNALNKKMLIDELDIDESRFMIINDYDKISLGNKTLQFIFTPWVHWPETICTYLIEDKILFTCDFFGSHIATSEMYADEKEIYLPAKRYYAEIMMPYANIIVKNLIKVKALDISIIAPSHGPMYNNPSYIISTYDEWVSKDVKPEVVIIYISMHGSTKKMVQYLVSQLMLQRISVKEYNLIDAEIGQIAMDIVDASTLVVASPSFLGGMHPKIVSALYLINALHPKTRILSYIGSYEWGSTALEQFKQNTNNFTAERLEPVLIQGTLKEDHYKDLNDIAKNIIEKNKDIGFKIIEKTEDVKDLSIVLCGEAGQGIEAIFGFLTTLLKDEGYNIFATKEYMSRVRGGTNSATIRLSSKPIEGYINRIDLLLILDKNAISHLEDRITDDTIIMGDKSTIHTNHKIIDLPFDYIASQIGSKLFANTVATGIVLGLFNGNLETLKLLLKEKFSNKAADVIDKNIEAAIKGYDLGQNILKDDNNKKISLMLNITKDPNVHDQILMYGAESIGLGAIAGGCNFIAAYPMSPSTGVLIYLASKRFDFGIVVEQAEDEIAGINMAIGAWYAGARALANTAGGGFSLMTEGVSLAGMIESPLVIHIAQRPGPATGLPTRTAQEDLELALYSGHGEFCRIMYAPGTATEGFYLTQKAFNMAAKYQIPVFILTDQYFMDTLHNITPLNIDHIDVEQNIIETELGYKRYALVQDGISPRGIPGFGKGLVCVDSDEHDETGHITESMDVRRSMVIKRLARFKQLEKEVVMPTIIGNDNYSTLIISWGTTFGSIKEAIRNISRSDITYMHYSQIYPLHPNTASWIKKARKVIVIENNSTGQFSKLIRRETGFDTKKMLKDDGMPFSVEELTKNINEFIGK